MVMTTKLLPRHPPSDQCLKANNANPCDSIPYTSQLSNQRIVHETTTDPGVPLLHFPFKSALLKLLGSLDVFSLAVLNSLPGALQ